MASADRIVGRVEWRAPAASRWSPLRADGGDALGIGSRVRTGDHSFAGLRLANGSSLRVAPHSELLFAAGREISLTSGTLYVDSGSAGTSTGSPFEVVTPAGRAVEIGTQYSVSYDADSGYVLRVREGRVRLLRGAGVIESIAGEMLRIDAVGQVEQDTVTPTSKTWQWTQIVAPVPDIEAQPVTRLLDWVTRETGFGLRYASPATRERATRTLLHGDIGTLTPIDALDVLLATTDLQYTLLDDGTIEVGARTAD